MDSSCSTTDRYRRNGSPILVTLVSFWHYAVVRKQVLTPSIAFTSVSTLVHLNLAIVADS